MVNFRNQPKVLVLFAEKDLEDKSMLGSLPLKWIVEKGRKVCYETDIHGTLSLTVVRE